MKKLLLLAANMAFPLAVVNVCFGQCYPRTNFVFNVAGVARAEDSHNEPVVAALPQADLNSKSTAAGSASASTINAHFSSIPSGADIHVDGAYVGTTPLLIDLSCCFHDVTISKPGLKPWSGRIRNNHRCTTIHVFLRKRAKG